MTQDCLEPRTGFALTNDLPRTHRTAYSFEIVGAQIDKFEQLTEHLASALCDHHAVGPDQRRHRRRVRHPPDRLIRAVLRQ